MRNQRRLPQVALLVGGLAMLAAGADHLEEYIANSFSTVPTIGTLFLLNFIAASGVGVGLLLPLGHVIPRHGERVRGALALSGIGIAVSSLVGLWISEQSTLFGFMDHGFRPAVVAAIAAEATAALSLGAYLAMTGMRLRRLKAAGRPA
jgi:hypothetical protein